jgi:hypothetical protein
VCVNVTRSRPVRAGSHRAGPVGGSEQETVPDPARVRAAALGLVFALTSIITITAPVVVVLIAPDRSAQVLATWKEWLLAHSRSIALIFLMVIGVFLTVRGAYDLAA